MNLRFRCADLLTEADGRNLARFNGWFVLSMLVFAAGSFLIGRGYVGAPVGWIFVAATAVCGTGAIAAYVVFLRTSDELLRKIQLDALAIGFGAGLLFMLVYRLCERLGAPKLDVADPLPIMIVFCAVGQWIGFRRYAAGEAEA